MTISESPSTKILERSSALDSFKSSSKTEVSVTFVNACTNVPTWSVSVHPIPSCLGLPGEIYQHPVQQHPLQQESK